MDIQSTLDISDGDKKLISDVIKTILVYINNNKSVTTPTMNEWINLYFYLYVKK